MEIPFVSLRSHRETIQAKDETIAVLRETIQSLTQSLRALEHLAETVTQKPPAQRVRTESDAERKPLDYAAIDPNDNEAVVQAALREMGPGKHNAARLQHRVEHIRRQLVQGRQARMERAQQPGPPPPPEAISEMIEQAIQQGKDDAGER